MAGCPVFFIIQEKRLEHHCAAATFKPLKIQTCLSIQRYGFLIFFQLYF
ncbi:hypothetical protein HOLDEFILI_01434 [Holdemania filiformis DSM 12042]|uniref:Uncharacterized protein n=1 Tax=Holdemania filiformis DSM 12042 TaxID=545696 RepID=B9Y6J3_9FIRM|nr:hypothetical protein HOLDEFILI_01434 [Holdemania filiformis DSM 12042]